MNNPEPSKRILETAETLFARKGFDAVSIREIAKLAEVQSSTIYYYFKDKRGVYKGVLDKSLSDLNDIFDSKLQDVEEPSERLIKYFNIYAEYLQSRQKFAALILQAVYFDDPDLKYLVEKYWAKHHVIVDRILRDGIETGIFREMDTSMATITIRGMILWHFMSFPITELLPGFKDQKDDYFAKLTGETLNLLLHGVLRDK